MIVSKEEFKKKLEILNLENVSQKEIYRVSISYIFRSIFLNFIIILLMILFFDGINYTFSGILTNILRIFLLIYISYTTYLLFSYKIVVYENNILEKKSSIDIKKIKKIEIDLYKINKYERCMIITTLDNKKYIFRLNISNKYKFIKKISLLSKVDINVIS